MIVSRRLVWADGQPIYAESRYVAKNTVVSQYFRMIFAVVSHHGRQVPCHCPQFWISRTMSCAFRANMTCRFPILCMLRGCRIILVGRGLKVLLLSSGSGFSWFVFRKFQKFSSFFGLIAHVKLLELLILDV